MYDGTTLSSVTSLTSNPAPSHAIFLEAFENRLWVAETGSKLNFCGTRDYQDWGGSVSDSGGFIYVEDGDGAQITGLGILDGIPVVFKGNWDRGPYSISKVTGMSVDDFTAKIMTKGTSCVSGYTVKNFLNDLLFVGQEGVFSHQQVRDYEKQRAFPVSKSVDSMFKADTAKDAVYDPVTDTTIVLLPFRDAYEREHGGVSNGFFPPSHHGACSWESSMTYSSGRAMVTCRRCGQRAQPIRTTGRHSRRASQRRLSTAVPQERRRNGSGSTWPSSPCLQGTFPWSGEPTLPTIIWGQGRRWFLATSSPNGTGRSAGTIQL